MFFRIDQVRELQREVRNGGKTHGALQLFNTTVSRVQYFVVRNCRAPWVFSNKTHGALHFSVTAERVARVQIFYS